MANRSTHKLVAALLVFAAAGGVFAWRFSSGDTEAEADYTTEWMCAACRARFSLTGAGAAAAALESGGVPIYCEKCRAKHAFQVSICPVCRTAFFGSEVPDSTGLCPQCNPDAKPARAVFPMLSQSKEAPGATDENSATAPPELPPNRN